jgi:4-aminobutyrate aminotransferase-like enzyme
MSLRATLSRIGQRDFPGLIVEGQGASAVADFIACRETLVAAQELARRIAVACLKQGLLVHFTGPLSTRIALLPPLTMSDEELFEGTERLTRAFLLTEQ